MIEIRPLRPEDDRSRFTSGDADLDRFFRRFAGQNQFRLHIGTTYVAVADGVILGFVTVVAASITVDDLSGHGGMRFPNYPLPVLRVARLAIANSAQGQGIGHRLLRAAFRIASDMAERVGCVGVVVDAKPAAVSFYEQFGFEAIDVIAGQLGDRPMPLPMFLALGSIPQDG